MKNYNYKYHIGTPDALTKNPSKLVNSKSNPFYKYHQNVLQNMKEYFKGDTNDFEWQ